MTQAHPQLAPALDASAPHDTVSWAVFLPQYARHNGPDADMGAYGGPQATWWR